jgi:Cd(II)/Pb(II)-responsive transcriptional regulator
MKIGELAQRTGCAVVTLRYYEQQRLLPQPGRSVGNYRLYDETHLERVLFIRHCRSLDMTLGEIRLLLALRDQPAKDCGEVNTLLDAHIRRVEARVEELLQLKRHLAHLRERCVGVRPMTKCGILDGLNGLACQHESG